MVKVHIPKINTSKEEEKLEEPEKKARKPRQKWSPLCEVEENGMIYAQERGEPETHWRAKLRLRRLMEKIGYDVKMEKKLPPIPVPNKDTMRYTIDLHCRHPVLETMDKYIDIGNNKGDGTYHSSDFHIRHKKLENRKKDIEDILLIRLFIFGLDEVIGPYAQSDEWFYRQLGIEIPFETKSAAGI